MKNYQFTINLLFWSQLVSAKNKETHLARGYMKTFFSAEM